MKILEFITAFFAWIQIAVSPLIIGLLISIIVYKNHPTKVGAMIGILITVLGLIVGIIWATKVWKKQGTVEFMSKVSSNSELIDSDTKQEPQH